MLNAARPMPSWNSKGREQTKRVSERSRADIRCNFNLAEASLTEKGADKVLGCPSKISMMEPMSIEI
jgi:hypothetical protein